MADVILLDQRGAGRSDRGLFCRAPEGEMPPLDLFADLTVLERRALEAARRCRAELAERGVDLAGYTTDMLGHPEVTEVLVDFFSGDDVAGPRVALPRPRFVPVEEAKRQRSVE